ncbi:DUF4190 domain-containing protein [Actinoplanes sp. TBRC 11911]|uniref:DUF4190 domain-containing protein n=1 Tax=Actinoplanes sp. TBRC 11911 TaxID=2729386 RepID=UPI00145DCF98|nr:DUF4190 domain-containing protein [Actinoplanes sp. TBRC 11911]NMO52408.1 DUF4190 domain-containing protein [Actinoplanes sp. TBRC 11911]
MTYPPPDPYAPPPQEPDGVPPTRSFSVPPTQPYGMPPVEPYTPPTEPYSAPPTSPYRVPAYGGPPAPAYVAPYVQPTIMVTPVRPNSTVAVWALVLGIVGLVAGWCLLALPCVAAVILGHIGLADTRSGAKAGRGMAIAGLVTGYVGLVPEIILFFWLFMGGILSAGAAAG